MSLFSSSFHILIRKNIKEFHIFTFQNRLLVQKKCWLQYMGRQVVTGLRTMMNNEAENK